MLCEAVGLCWRHAYSRYFVERGYSAPPTREVLFFSGYATPAMMPRAGIFAESIPLIGNQGCLCPIMRGMSRESCQEYKKYARQHLRRKQAGEQAAARQNIPPEIRRQVAAQCRYCCVYCERNIKSNYRGQKILGVIDHAVPLALGGSNEISNFVLACRRCNSDKGIHIWAKGCRKEFYK